jgi:hypothetical protein
MRVATKVLLAIGFTSFIAGITYGGIWSTNFDGNAIVAMTLMIVPLWATAMWFIATM